MKVLQMIRFGTEDFGIYCSGELLTRGTIVDALDVLYQHRLSERECERALDAFEFSGHNTAVFVQDPPLLIGTKKLDLATLLQSA